MTLRDDHGAPPPGGRRPPKPRGVLWRFTGWWLGGWWQTVRRAFVGPETRAMATDFRELGRRLKEDVAAWRSAPREAPARLTYAAMLAAWGIEAEDVPEVLRMMRIARRKILVLATLAYGALLWQIALDGLRSPGYLGLVALCALTLSMSAVVLSWRLYCLRIGRHERFFAWIGFPRPTCPR